MPGLQGQGADHRRHHAGPYLAARAGRQRRRQHYSLFGLSGHLVRTAEQFRHSAPIKGRGVNRQGRLQVGPSMEQEPMMAATPQTLGAEPAE